MPHLKIIDGTEKIFFITFKTIRGINVFTDKRKSNVIIQSLKYCVENKNLHIIAYALLINHLHLIFWTGDDPNNFIRDFKRFTTRQILLIINQENNFNLLNQLRYQALTTAKATYRLWRLSTHPELIISEYFLLQKVNYVELNPLHHNLVEDIENYPYTSYHNRNCKHELLIPVEWPEY